MKAFAFDPLPALALGPVESPGGAGALDPGALPATDGDQGTFERELSALLAWPVADGVSAPALQPTGALLPSSGKPLPQASVHLSTAPDALTKPPAQGMIDDTLMDPDAAPDPLAHSAPLLHRVQAAITELSAQSSLASASPLPAVRVAPLVHIAMPPLGEVTQTDARVEMAQAPQAPQASQAPQANPPLEEEGAVESDRAVRLQPASAAASALLAATLEQETPGSSVPTSPTALASTPTANIQQAPLQSALQPAASEPRGELRIAPQIEATIERLAETRHAAQATRPEILMRHGEFGLVTMRLDASSGDLRATLAARDPGFVPAVQAALAERAVTPVSDSAATQRGQDQSGTASHSGSSQGFSSNYGSSPGSSQGSPSPRLDHHAQAGREHDERAGNEASDVHSAAQGQRGVFA